MKRQFTSAVFLLCSLLTFAQFSGTVSDSQGVKYTANDDESTCYVSGHESNYSATIVIPEVIEGRQVTSIDRISFRNCSGLTSITIPNSVTSIGQEAFAGTAWYDNQPNGLVYAGKVAYKYKGAMPNNTTIIFEDGTLGISDNAFYDCKGLTSLTIPSSMTSIGASAFYCCKGLESLTIPSSVTSIGGGAFAGCSGLLSIVVEDGNTVYDSRDNCNAIIRTADNTLLAACNNTIIPSTITVIGYRAFFDCKELTSLTIPKGITLIDRDAFYGCSGLTLLTIPSSVTSISSRAFVGCSGFTSIMVEEGNTVYDSRDNCNAIIKTSDNALIVGCKNTVIPSSVTSIGDGAFHSRDGLTSVTIPSSVTSIGDEAFYLCSGLTSVTIPSSVTLIGGGAFSCCSSLTSVTIPSTVTEIGNQAFFGCCNLTSLSIPSSVTSIGDIAFERCNSLTSVTVGWETPLGIEDNIFQKSNNQNATLYVPKGTKAAYEAANVWKDFSSIVEMFDKTDGELSDSQGVKYTANDDESTCYVSGHEDNYSATIVIPEIYEGRRVTSIGDVAFCDCGDLTSVTIPSSVTSIGGWAFRGCNLTSLIIPSSVTSIGGYAFEYCSGLTSLTIPSSVISIGDNAFQRCKGLTSIVVENGNTVYDSRNNCNAIIRTFDNVLITGCKNTVVLSSVTTIGNHAFLGSDGLTSLTIPSSVTSIGEGAFADCSGLTSLTIPSSVTSIGRDVFFRCSGLTSLTIPSNVKSIDFRAFCDCSGLTSLTIPSSVTSIGESAFSGCTALTLVTVGWETPLEIEDNVFQNSNNQNVTLYVPRGTKAAYEAADVWKGFGTIFECDLPQESVESTDVSAIDNVIYIAPLEVTRGTEVTVPLQMKNTAGVRGFQFDMYLPLGVTVKKDGNNRFICSLNDDRKPSGDQHTLTVNEQADGAIRFLCGSQYDETFTGTEGEILTVQLCVDEKMLAGLYPIILKNVKLTETNINNFYLTETVQTALTVIPYIPGDISGDDVIDVSDYIGVANYILGTPQAGITAAAADVNKDNLVDVSDYIGVANLILYNNIYGQTANASRRWQKRVNTDVSALNNVVYISPFEAASNGETQVSIRMKNTVGIRGFQFDLYLPEGITAKKYGNGRIVCTLNDDRRPVGDQHTLTLSERPDGAIRFLCGSQYDETFTGSDGEIATLTINVAADVEADNYPIYLRNMKLTETDINNYYTTDEIETSVTVTGPADGRIVLDEASTTAPEAANGVDVRVKRTINANEWSTICLPFAMSATQVKAAFGNDVQLADFTSYDTVEDTGENVVGLTVNFNMVTAIEANHPYVIKVSNAISEFTADNVTIDPEEEPCVEYNNGLTGKKRVVWGIFTGTYVADCVIPYEGDDVSLFLSGNKWWYATAQTKHMKGYRAYFWFTDLLPDVSASRIQMAFNDETANVVELKDGRMEELKSCYNLKGQRVEKPLKKGLYIRNAKKVIIK